MLFRKVSLSEQHTQTEPRRFGDFGEDASGNFKRTQNPSAKSLNREAFVGKLNLGFRLRHAFALR